MKAQNSDTKVAMKVSWTTVVINAVLTAFKLFAGIFANSFAMIADAVHSASDVFSTFIVMIGVKAADKKSDSKHPYGHERFECVAAIVLAVVLLIVGIAIGYAGIDKIVKGDYSHLVVPGLLALIAAIVSIVVKEWMYWYTRAAAKKINSSALKADAWHHRSDALSSIGSFVGILGARLGFPLLDPIASLIICFFIVYAAVSIFREAIGKMTDEACDEKTEQEIVDTILKQPHVISVDMIKTRKFGNRIYVDSEISLCSNLSFSVSHDIVTDVHDVLEKTFPKIKHCTVHANPKTMENGFCDIVEDCSVCIKSGSIDENIESECTPVNENESENKMSVQNETFAANEVGTITDNEN